ncbi:DUF3883 domain-containing protein [Oceanobacillus piezotolerans]|uniref:DUF3883 domain-containing protein n=1 Tax=Oceanobacillus piezotolerans TaxID=2448030 RepID=A0A498DCN8_9BACI|nr:DUF3883 domain-containing protein [Oceanobacillus piezotolerans]RLL43911.1 DUF3883 domain-containing protein [Oceanobacillus piezotolerans]
MADYKIPDEYFFRLHHPRPRFKTDIENVLIYIANEITSIGRKNADEFVRKLNASIRRYPGNLSKTQKTIDNWRTEIDALFCFIEQDGLFLQPSNRAIELAANQDLVKFFKLFCYHFQYPGGFVKPKVNLKYLKAGINFRPASYLLQMMHFVENEFNVRAGISKSEATHCIFNDLRVTRDGRSVEKTWDLIVNNRRKELDYDWTGDVVRYAGDILDYMTQANLLVKRPNGKYYINHVEDLAVQRFINHTDDLFDYYNYLPSSIENITLRDVKEIENEWIQYFNTEREDSFFDTDILALMTESSDEYNELKALVDLDKLIEENDLSTTGAIGSIGESLILNHEKKNICNMGRSDLKHLIQRIPTILAIGYDINSREIDEKHKHIEVKTTASSTPVDFYRFHLTPNEWTAAESSNDRYFVYRLMVNKTGAKLFVIQDPVAEYKTGNLSASPRNGMDIYFDPNKCGKEVKLIL